MLNSAATPSGVGACGYALASRTGRLLSTGTQHIPGSTARTVRGHSVWVPCGCNGRRGRRGYANEGSEMSEFAYAIGQRLLVTMRDGNQEIFGEVRVTELSPSKRYVRLQLVGSDRKPWFPADSIRVDEVLVDHVGAT